jgi:Flp pilus assembly pilin Flp
VARWRPGPLDGADVSAAPECSPGQGMVEDSLIMALVAIAVMVILAGFGYRISELYSNVNNGLSSAAG